MATREDLHRLVDAVPDDQLTAVGETVVALVRSDMTTEQLHHLAEVLSSTETPVALVTLLKSGITPEQLHQLLVLLIDRPAPAMDAEPVRKFASAGSLSAESDLAERVEEIMRSEPGTAA